MFCVKCGKEISDYEVCGGDVIGLLKSDHFDQNTGEQWFRVKYLQLFECSKWDHWYETYNPMVTADEYARLNYQNEYNDKYWKKIVKMMKESNIPVPWRGNWSDIKVSEKYVKNEVLVIGKCDLICCPHCGYVHRKSGGDCFIATAVYDSPMAPEVKLLRQFRNEVLSQTKPGQILVAIYYRISPPLAHTISKSTAMKKMVRNYILEPIVKILKKSASKINAT